MAKAPRAVPITEEQLARIEASAKTMNDAMDKFREGMKTLETRMADMTILIQEAEQKQAQIAAKILRDSGEMLKRATRLQNEVQRTQRNG